MTSPDAIVELYSDELSEIFYRISLKINSMIREQDYILSDELMEIFNSEINTQVEKKLIFEKEIKNGNS